MFLQLQKNAMLVSKSVSLNSNPKEGLVASAHIKYHQSNMHFNIADVAVSFGRTFYWRFS
mgnify:CR=1 FL=1